jgi:hypothetical protein
MPRLDSCNLVINTALVTMAFVVTEYLGAVRYPGLALKVSCSLRQVIFGRLW